MKRSETARVRRIIRRQPPPPPARIQLRVMRHRPGRRSTTGSPTGRSIPSRSRGIYFDVDYRRRRIAGTPAERQRQQGHLPLLGNWISNQAYKLDLQFFCRFFSCLLKIFFIMHAF